ncbi:MAG: TetR/AcrR family transcriptional regulator [Gammaproteobacteria bacterium]
MPAAIVPKDEVLDRLAQAFRENGYDGASIARLSEATGLGKASLYHYFKGGKQEMAAAVLGHVGGRFGKMVIAPLRGTGQPARRLRAMSDGLNDFYSQGRSSCILDLFGIGQAGELFRPQLKGAIHRFKNALGDLLREAGLDQTDAETKAEDAIVALQGALVVSRATGDRSVFHRVLEELPSILPGNVKPDTDAPASVGA